MLNSYCGVGIGGLFETYHIDEPYSVEPYGDAAYDAGGVGPVVDGLEGGVVDNLEIFGFEAQAVGCGVDLVP